MAALPRVHIVQWGSLREEAEGLASFVEHLIAHGHSPADILILSPRRLIGYGIRDALVERHISTHSFFHEEALDDDEAQIAFCMLTLLANNEDRVALHFWLGHGSPSWRHGAYQILREYCEESGNSPWPALESLEAGTLTLPRVGDLVARFRTLKTRLAQFSGLQGGALIDALLPDGQDWAKALREIAILKVHGWDGRARTPR